MRALILIGALIAGWLILSQLIAWMITPGKNEDEVVQNWLVIFMLPIVLLVVGVMVIETRFRRLAYRYGFPDVFGLFGGE